MEVNQIAFLSVIVLFLVDLALPPALRNRSWKRFFIAFVLSAIGILIPFFFFVGSAFFVPDWKGGCQYGWLDCFQSGKLVLTPLVLWACAAFYVIQILKPVNRFRAWVVLGIFTGAIVSVLCFVFGVVIYAFQHEFPWWPLVVPLYVAVWYLVLCVRTVRASGLGILSYIITILGTLPLWVISLILSRKHYLSLPDSPPRNCFVVTSALRGHELFVGPFSKIERDGVVRVANQQLLTFWKFESIWQDRFPGTHRIFRRIYNRVGPGVARRIRTKLAADIVYLLIKPFEAMAAIIVYVFQRKQLR